LQLDRVPLSPRFAVDSGTGEPGCGVETASDPASAPAFVPKRGAPLSLRGALAFGLGILSLLGQGERSKVDPRLVSPSRTIASYWEALRQDDEEAALECTVEGNPDVPYPGMLWFLPPTAEITLTGFKSLPVTSGHVMVTYVVCYRPIGTVAQQAFVSGCELVRQRGEWRILRAIGEAGMPAWKPTPRAVDI